MGPIQSSINSTIGMLGGLGIGKELIKPIKDVAESNKQIAKSTGEMNEKQKPTPSPSPKTPSTLAIESLSNKFSSSIEQKSRLMKQQDDIRNFQGSDFDIPTYIRGFASSSGRGILLDRINIGTQGTQYAKETYKNAEYTEELPKNFAFAVKKGEE